MSTLLKLDQNGTPLWRVLALIIVASFCIGFVLRDSVADIITKDIRRDIARIEMENIQRDRNRTETGKEFREALNRFEVQLAKQNVVLELLRQQLERDK